MFQNSANLFILKFKCAKFQTFLFFQKNDLSSSGILKKKNPIFKLGIGFFSDFAKKPSNFPNNLKYIFFELQLSQVSAKKKTFLDRSFIHSFIPTRVQNA